MPKQFIHFTFLLFILTALSGIWMRAIPFVSLFSLNYENVLHAHSHIAILGWAFLGVVIVILALIWPGIKQKKQGIFLIGTLFIVSVLMFIAFVYEGYAIYSIIMSTLHIFVEYWAIYYIYNQVKLQERLPSVGKLFINGALFTLAISSIGPFLLGYLGATGLRDSKLFEMAIYFFLHYQYNGWLFLFLIGSFIFILDKKGITLPTRRLLIGFGIYFISLLPWYFSAILWANLGSFSNVLATIGSLGQWIGIICILLAFKNAWKSIVIATSRLTTVCLTVTFLLLFFKSTMELGLISPTIATLVFNTRSVIIGYLHFTLLGFVSLSILTQFLLTRILDPKRLSVMIGFTIFISGFILNEIVLFVTGLTSWLRMPNLPYNTVNLLIASILLCIGIVVLWFSTLSRERV